MKDFYSKLQPDLCIRIVYEDNHLLFAIKPPGIPSQSDIHARPDMLSLLRDYRKVHEQKSGEAWLGLVHRLDQPVAGLMVFAKTSKAASRLSDAFRKHEVQKIYYAVCRGQVYPASGTWEDRISDKKINGRFDTDPEGRYALLHYTCLEETKSGGGLSLLRLELITGRRHQIRIQSSVRGYPLAGDRRYGRMDDFDRELASPALFAAELSLKHPVTRESMHIALPLPEQSPWTFFRISAKINQGTEV